MSAYRLGSPSSFDKSAFLLWTCPARPSFEGPHSPLIQKYQGRAGPKLREQFGVQVREFVKDVLDIVELTPLKNALVGIPGVSGLSVEQRKRLTIAVELVANPSVIFMDEPTSGGQTAHAVHLTRESLCVTSLGS